MKLIAFVGPRRSGKDTCAAIAKEAGIVAGKIPFAGPLKRICSDVFNIPLEVFEHPEKKEESGHYPLSSKTLKAIFKGMDFYIPMVVEEVLELGSVMSYSVDKVLASPRHVLQYVGTEIIRAYDPDWHCKAAFSSLHLNLIGAKRHKTYAVTDCRFLNEHAYLSREHDTQFHYVYRPEAEALLANATHKSELEIVDVRKLILSTIPNTGTLEELAEQVVGGYK